MPERGAQVERWRSLGRLLPKEVRERIFDPAFADLTYGWLTGDKAARRLPFGLHVMGTWVGCFSVTIPRLFVRQGRLTRFGRFSLWAVGVGTTVALLVANMAQSYASSSP